MSPIEIVEADLADPTHADHYLGLMDHYALDPLGGGAPLPASARQRLVPSLRERSDVTILLAYEGREPVALATCIEGFSTFAARPLWNLHDMVVIASHRGRGIGARLLADLERRARQRGYCKITLEVLSGNQRAQAAYRRAGFAGYTLDPQHGAALFWQKGLAD